MERLGGHLSDDGDDKDADEDDAADGVSEIDMETASPPVSPSVVARILMSQKPRVTSGTLLSPAAMVPCTSAAP
jgi:hypothetical protein